MFDSQSNLSSSFADWSSIWWFFRSSI